MGSSGLWMGSAGLSRFFLFSAAGTGARHGEATINRDLPFVADANVRCGKRKVPVTVNSCVVVKVHHRRLAIDEHVSYH